MSAEPKSVFSGANYTVSSQSHRRFWSHGYKWENSTEEDLDAIIGTVEEISIEGMVLDSSLNDYLNQSTRYPSV